VVPLALDPATGLLSPGIHTATMAEVESVFVAAFPSSRTRRPIFDLWIIYRQAITSLLPIAEQWLNGSFTTGKQDPADADVVTFLAHTETDSLAEHERILLLGLFHGKKTKDGCRCDAYLVIEYPDGHPARS
jgi:hypothetical protein